MIQEYQDSIISHAELVQIARKWLINQNYGVVLTEYACSMSSIPDAIGFGNRASAVIECKISRSDFLADPKKEHRSEGQQLGNRRYYLVLPHVTDEAPDGWGLLVYDGRKVRAVQPAPLHEIGVRDAEYHLLYSLVRRAELRGLIPELLKPLESRP